MGLYDDRLFDLSESRQPRRAAQSSILPGARRARALEAPKRKRSKRKPSNKRKRRGSRAVAREDRPSMATKRKASRRRRSVKKAPKKRARRRARARAAVAAPVVATSRKRKRRRKVRAVVAAPVVKSSRRRRRRARASTVMQAPRRRRRRARASEAWRGDPTGHRKAAKKGHARKKRRGYKRRRRAREAPVVAAARRRSSTVMQASRRKRSSHRRRSRRMYAPKSTGRGIEIAELATAVVFGGIGFVLADGLDRFLATYDPSSTAAKPTNKFTSDGAGTLANALNIASKPSLVRIAAGVGATAVPALGAVYVKSPVVRAGLEGAALGAGISLFQKVWDNFLMPMLAPKDTTTPSLQKSMIARLYPAEIAAHINQTNSQTAASGVAFGALSGGDVGPFALSGPQDYPDVAQALRARAGLQDQYPSLQNQWGTGGPGGEYPTAAQVLGVGADPTATVVAPPATVVAPPATPIATAPAAVDDITKTIVAVLPGVAPAVAQQAAATVVSAPAATPLDVHASLQRALPHVHPPHLRAAADTIHRRIRQHHTHHPVTPAAASAAPAVAPPWSGPAVAPPMSAPAIAPPMMAPVQTPSFQPGPPSGAVGPQAKPNDCGCVGANNGYLGFIGDAEEDTLFNTGHSN